ncbi:ABC-three component system protein [Cryobacterium sp. Y29]|uniref:ABC-three component system protein n=1 Tax=Cryobacterium sp. Y29 TaxID=2048285 RepID=UPI0011B065B1|nr:ABC-three component system protein [Cryobacterium sp. Y29]
MTDAAGHPLSAIQLKQHVSQTSLTDKSVDLWKTIRVWLQTPSLAAVDGPMLTLVTTAPVQAGSAASLLGINDAERNIAKALSLLDTASGTGSVATQPGREAWTKVSPSVRASLLSRIRVLGEQASVAELDLLLDAELAPFVPSKHVAEYRSRLWGWWDSRAVSILLQNRTVVGGGSVSAAELYERMQTIRDDFRVDALVVDFTLDFDDEKVAAGHDEHFVDQLRWVKVGTGTLRNAVVDYLRAYAHTTKWVQNGDLFDDELERYQTALKDEWSRRFYEMIEDLETDGVIDLDVRAVRGRELFRTLSESVQVTIRPEFNVAFHARGTRHNIANDGEYGWHPDFERILAGVLVGAAE